MKKDRKIKSRDVRKPGLEKGQEKEVQSGLLALLPSLEGRRVILTVPLGMGKDDGRDA